MKSVIVCGGDTCSKHGKFIYFCRICHKEWEKSHPKTVAALAAMSDPGVSYASAKRLYNEAKRSEG